MNQTRFCSTTPDSKSTPSSDIPDPPAPRIQMSDFTKVNLIVGQIVHVADIKISKKLYKLHVDIGEEESIQIVSGVKQHMKCDDLLLQKVIVVKNMKPVTMANEISNGKIYVIHS